MTIRQTELKFREELLEAVLRRKNWSESRFGDFWPSLRSLRLASLKVVTQELTSAICFRWTGLVRATTARSVSIQPSYTLPTTKVKKPTTTRTTSRMASHLVVTLHRTICEKSWNSPRTSRAFFQTTRPSSGKVYKTKHYSTLVEQKGFQASRPSGKNYKP